MQIRQPAVAGTFYPAPRERLERDVHTMLATAAKHAEAVDQNRCPKALIVPHAGYVYSGAMAAAAYASIAPFAHHIRRVVLLGPAHRVAVKGMALPDAQAFSTPLGTVAIDQAAVQSIQDMPQVITSAAAHAAEHSLEVQLPFLQSLLMDFTLLPLAVGQTSADDVADVLDRVWGGPETLIVISSDLSHFLPYPEACRIDRSTTDAILSLQPLRTYQQACGAVPINGLLTAARRHALRPTLIGLCNSGDTAGDKSRVVGYASFAFIEESADD